MTSSMAAAAEAIVLYVVPEVKSKVVVLLSDRDVRVRRAGAMLAGKLKVTGAAPVARPEVVSPFALPVAARRRMMALAADWASKLRASSCSGEGRAGLPKWVESTPSSEPRGDSKGVD